MLPWSVGVFNRSLVWFGLVITMNGVSTSHAAETPAFAEIVAPFLEQHCVGCHRQGESSGEFRVDNLSSQVGTGPDTARWFEVIEKINNSEMPPRDEPNLPTAAEADAVVQWLADRIREGEATRMARRERVSFHRLTREEYAHTVKDLLGVQFDVSDPTGLSEDPDWNGFERIGSVLSLSPSHVEKYFAAAETILAEAYPDKDLEQVIERKNALDLRGGPSKEQIEQLEADGLADKVRVDMWPGHLIQGGRPAPKNPGMRAAGEYRVRLQVSGLKPPGGRAPHLTFYADKLDRMLFETDVLAPEEAPIILEFTTHLPEGSRTFHVANDVPGPSVLPRSGRSGRKPFFSLAEGRIPWQLKLTDEQGMPLYPFLILDWIEWEGPLLSESDRAKRERFLPDDASELKSVRGAITLFLEQAFRRPVSEKEIASFIWLYESQLSEGASARVAIKTAMLAGLCAADFYYLVEGSPDAERSTLNDWELASRLSYFLWSTMPDERLFASARAGTLHNRDVLATEAKRMLDDPRADRFTESFARQWLRLRDVGMFPPDSRLYPDYDQHLENSMVGETTEFFREVFRRNGTLKEFLVSDWTMLNSRLALHYGIEGVEEDSFRRVELLDEYHRSGILTHASVLSLTSDGTRHRPVHRGVWVSESILGKTPPPPPANVDPIEPNPVDAPKATIRMKLDAHKHHAQCAACHAKIDPLGLAFDHYDAIGRYRTIEKVQGGVGPDPVVDASGVLPDGRVFSDAAEFQQRLLEDIDTFNDTFIEKLATYAMRRAMTIDDHDDLSTVAAASGEQNYRLRDLIEAFILSDLFQKR